MNKLEEKQSFSIGTYLKFIVPSLLGIFLLMVPISVNGEITLMVAIWADFIDKYIGAYMPTIAVILISISVLGVIFTKLFQPQFLLANNFLRNMFDVGVVVLFSRDLAIILVI